MYEESAGFDQSSNNLHLEDGFSQSHNNNQSNFSMDESSYNTQIPISQQEIELQHQLNIEMEQCYNNNNNGGEIHEIVHDMGSFNNSENIVNNHYNHQPQNNDYNIQNGSILDQIPYPTTPDLLNMFPLPRCSSNITFSNTAHKPSPSPSFLASLGLLDLNPPAVAVGDGAAAVYDPLLPLNLPPQPPLLRELFHSLPNGGYTLGPRNGSLFDDREHVNGGLYQNGGASSYDNGVFEFTSGEIDCIAKNREGKDTKHFATERHRRVLLSDKYKALSQLVPSPSKNDRASVVADAINYINELKRTVAELKVLVEKKRCAKERLKRPKTEDDESRSIDNPYNDSTMRSSWLHRKSKNTEVDVRIIDDEVTVKLVQQKRINCLLFVSKVLDELQLDLHHVAGGLIGDYYSFLFNSKICEGSIVYASAVANKLIEVVDKQYAAFPPTNSY